VGESGKKWEKLIYFTPYFKLMANLIGVFDLKVDSKGRFIFPASLRKQLLDETETGFVMKRSIFNQCIELFPFSTWQKEAEQVGKLNRFVKKNNDFIRMFMSGSRQVSTDEAGRLLIPRDLMLFGNIGKDIVLASAIDRIEIWSKDAYEAFVAAGSNTFPSLAEEVMGLPDNNAEKQ
jgi:MraZ protein